ncbi:MAG: hypothetical protein IT367_09270, partial [Candidatus Hydrogenedentes bacterium]|nr:hypothetical protein [Candidatus Hydrogenedentota bacterium]
MQISTIDVRNEGVDRPASSKKAGKDDANPDSAFAAFFATQLDAHRQPEAKPATKSEADSDSEVDPADEARATPTNQTKVKHHREAGSTANAKESATAASTAPQAAQSVEGEQTIESGQVEATAVIVLQPRQAASSATFTVVAKEDAAATVKLHVSAAQPLVTGNAKAGAEEVAPVASVPSLLPEAQAEVPDTAKAAITPLAPSVQTGPAVVEVEPESKVTPQPAPKLDAAAGEGSAKADYETSVVRPAPITNDSGERKEQGTRNETAQFFTEPAAKLPVSKLQSHAVTTETAPVQAADDSVNGVPKISVPQATDSGEDVAVTPLDDLAGDAIESVAGAPDNQNADARTVRNVTQVVSQDGTIVAARTNEVRSENTQATGQREIVVIEKTTIQALPEQALRGARFLLNSAEQTMRIRLMPESLGEVRLEVVAA